MKTLRILINPATKPAVVLTVTNDLTYDQRMQRIAQTLAEAGCAVTLVGRALPHSRPLDERMYRQFRLRCRFRRGVLFYAEYNLRLFFWLLRQPFNAVGSVDLDTLPAGCLAGILRGKERVFDAHEYFTEVPELVDRPLVRGFWSLIARCCLPFYRHAYTVGPELARIFSDRYGLPFRVVRNVPLPAENQTAAREPSQPPVLLYQGALNAGRGIEQMLDAMAQLEGFQLWLAGEGDLSEELRQRALRLQLGDKVRFLGYVTPEALKALTMEAWLGLNLLENRGLSYYYSLANKFFDYVQAGVPVLNMDFPEYRALHRSYEVGLLLPELSPGAIAAAVKSLRDDPVRYRLYQDNCRAAAQEWNWDKEKKVLLQVWSEALGRDLTVQGQD